jgi:hypothetical protein
MEFGFRDAAITDNLIKDCAAATNYRSSNNGAARRSPAMWRPVCVSGSPCAVIENEMRGSKKANIVAMLQTEGVWDDLALPGAANP